MSSSREQINPLRPYYIPPSIGPPPEPAATSSHGGYVPDGRNTTMPSYASSARDMFSDIDYSEYVSESSQSTLDTIRKLLDEAMYKYISVLLAQPFDVAKTVLQVRSQAGGDSIIATAGTDDKRDRRSSNQDSVYSEYASDDSEPDELTYFTSTAPSANSYSPSRSRRRRASERSGYGPPPSSSSIPSHKLVLHRADSLLEVLSQLWTKEGARGVWKGVNATFVYSVLLKTFESWSRGLLAAVVNVPGPGIISGLAVADVAESPYPWASLGVAVAAAALAGLILAPLDLIRTKLVLTSTSTTNRGVRNGMRLLPSFICPPEIVLPTIIHNIIPPLITQGTPLLLRTQFSIDPIFNPALFSFTTFLSATAELFLKLPFETVLRRGQMAVLQSSTHIQSSADLKTIVDVGEYRGTLGTMWLIAREEGTSETVTAAGGKKGKKAIRKGQGVQGLWRGWRVGMWGLVGVWGVAAMGGAGGSGGEF